MYSVKIRKHIMIAHSLQHPGFGPAQNLHGATYVVDATFKSESLTDMNIVIDIDKALKLLEEALKPLDYKNLDELPELKSILTTTEFLAAYIHGRISEACRDYFSGILKITLGESHIAWASFEQKIS
jgi:6-pyruvoyltetrahydropterin/6-carboxytetrahydropterin synthase